MNIKPRVTIGLPVYNGAKYVAQALRSLLSQTFEDFELLIADNCSTDETAEICMQFASEDTRIRYMRHQQNIGAVANFNFLVDEACGEYFKWAAHDDICEPTLVARCVEVLDQHMEFVMCQSRSDQIDADGVSWLDRLPVNDEEVDFDADGTRRWAGFPRRNSEHARPSKRFAGVLLGSSWSVEMFGLIRTETLRASRMLAESYGSEKVLIGELSLAGKNHLLSQVLFKQRVHSEAAGYSSSQDAQNEFTLASSQPRIPSPRLSLLMAHFRVVATADISGFERLCCYVALVRYVLQIKKWPRVLKFAISGQGLGGGARRIMEAGVNRA